MKKTLFGAAFAVLSLVVSGVSAEPKRVIVCTVTTGFRHSSISEAEKTLQLLADESKAYTIVDFVRQPPAVNAPKPPQKPKDLAANADDKAKAKYEADMKKYEEEKAKWTPEMDKQVKDAKAQFDAAVKEALKPLSPENLDKQKIDAVIFANTTGDLPLPDREGLIKWIENGHSFIATHSGSDTFHGFPGYINMLGGEFRTHGAQVPADLTQADANHPATKGLPNPWNISQEEVYEFKNHDPKGLHVLWYLKHPPQKKDQTEYAGVSWCKMAGTGRVFYTSLGHREDLWSADPALKDRKNSIEISKQYQQHLLGGIKWALGLAEGDSKPNPETITVPVVPVSK